MDCAKIEASLSAYMDAELSSDETHLIEAHLASCVSCQARLDVWKFVAYAVRGTYEEIRAPEDMLAQVMSHVSSARQGGQIGRVARLLAIVLCAFGVVGVAVTLSSIGLVLWPFFHLLLPLLGGLYGFRSMISTGWIVAGGIVSLSLATLWLRLMNRVLKSVRNEVVI
ncbi:anti-sigma factor [Alicyclobacillus sp. SP_1]|uniref:anti-sigma factor family protein n=1 Tax=Alicyclobacillus sp. SP_1 TaxID=2942475 RepID=UPI002157F60A|nr:zf-HC2 domain-containing protein [Alicyclobacillus sp. SP_1]